MQHPGVVTDTRKIKEGDLFFALKGPNFDGNSFAEKALEAGAAYAIIDNAEYNTSPNTILVQDVLESLQQLALFHRSKFSIPFIAITGSNGKTTTKELIHAVLSKKYNCYTTEGNLNNHIGIPLTLLKIQTDAEIAVVEMGANHLNEIASYCQYTKPTHGLITNLGKAHLEGFGSVDGVRKGKGELLDYLRENDGTAFINMDDPYLLNMSTEIKEVITYGENPLADINGIPQESDGFLAFSILKGADISNVKTQLVGNYNFPNALAAVTIGSYFRVPHYAIKEALESYAPSNSRSQYLEKDGNKIILDAYNANPSSMKAAIENFAGMHHPNKILILGSMKEMGADSDAEHQQLADLIAEYNWQKVLLAGPEFQKTNTAFEKVTTTAEAKEWFKDQQIKNAMILIKGSRGMQMEKVLE